jgi:hypothetical protein
MPLRWYVFLIAAVRHMKQTFTILCQCTKRGQATQMLPYPYSICKRFNHLYFCSVAECTVLGTPELMYYVIHYRNE